MWTDLQIDIKKDWQMDRQTDLRQAAKAEIPYDNNNDNYEI